MIPGPAGSIYAALAAGPRVQPRVATAAGDGAKMAPALFPTEVHVMKRIVLFLVTTIPVHQEYPN